MAERIGGTERMSAAERGRVAERVGVVVVGGGVGGLVAAIRLRVAGHDVTLLERNPVVGGKLAVVERDGFRFDVGPSLVTLPHVLDEPFRLAGTSLAAEVDLVRLDPQFRCSWPDGRELVVGDSGCEAPGWQEFVDHGRRIWEVSERTFLAGPMERPAQLLRRMRRPSDLLAIDPLRTLHRAARRHFDDPHLVQWAGRYATYSGSSPFAAPATLGCIAHVEAAYGCWHPRGGLGALRDAYERVARRTGVVVRTDAEVVAITTGAPASTRAVPGSGHRSGSRSEQRITGVRLDGGEVVAADVVVANADARHLYGDLLPDRRGRRRVERARPSTSGLVVVVGAEGTTPGLAHHNVWFSADDRAEFEALAAGRMAADPTVYACISSVTDPTQAPAGCENWFLLVNTPAGIQLDGRVEAARILAHLARRGPDLRDRARFVEVITPADMAQRYRAPGGAIYGTSSDGRRSAFVRPANRGTVPGLYLVGGSSHPGGGLPLVTISARIVADMIATDLATRGPRR